MREADFVAARAREVGCEGHRLLALAGALVVQVAEADVGRRVRGVLPLTHERRRRLVHHDARQLRGIGDDEGHQLGPIHFARRVGVRHGRRVRLQSTSHCLRQRTCEQDDGQTRGEHAD